jgi:hypothetical protein
MGDAVLRDERGHFLPGTASNNPTGRPKGAGAISELARENAPAALNKIVALIGSTDENVALKAAQTLLDRAYGKPMTHAEISATVENTGNGTGWGEMPWTSVESRGQAFIQAMQEAARIQRLEEELAAANAQIAKLTTGAIDGSAEPADVRTLRGPG